MDAGASQSIAGVAIKGRANGNQWVKTFKVKISTDSEEWADVDSGATLTGNTDRNTQVLAKFKAPVQTRYVRIYPQTWSGFMSMRCGLLMATSK